MLVMLAIVLMVVAGAGAGAGGGRVVRAMVPSASRRGRRLSLLAVGLAAALISVPGAAWASAAGAQSQAPAAEVDRLEGIARPVPTRSAQANEYAAREAHAKGLEKFEGGDTTVVIGGSALVIIVVVLLILILI